MKLYVRANGLRMEATMPGYLHIWVHVADDSWIGNVGIEATLQRQKFPMRLWVTADAVTQLEPPREV